MKLFLTSFVQVFLVCANTVFICKGNVLLMAATSFGINWFWTHNVKKVSFGGESDRMIYAFGATCGCVAGYYFTQFIATL